ncbi:MAG: response regulator transcription factor [Polaromonas sp.]|uniref:response regulator transcription factor n=1 Tax=Polaromonas sp. TaxID=1869339 RepID=UPI002733F580|nr:response regulator transcription factor [Polaromonas sp.]MDP2818635.1 response regulator transcription factor [Polaromonas sp.]
MTAASPDESPRIRVLVADDQALVRRGMTLMLAVEPDIEVVGQACDGAEAVEMAQQLLPDVVLMDLHMPRMGGVAATRAITLSLPRTHVLVLTTLDAEETVFEAIRAGAHAYLLKDATEEELLETVRAVHRGESRLTPQIARKVMDQFRRLAPLPEGPPGDAALSPAVTPQPVQAAAQTKAQSVMTEPLTDKEEKILQCITEGKSNRQIANAVFLAEGTVKNYVSRIMEKLHANTRTELAVMSVRQRRGD